MITRHSTKKGKQLDCRFCRAEINHPEYLNNSAKKQNESESQVVLKSPDFVTSQKKQFEESNFNIHIYMPPNNFKNINLYISGIQDGIKIHFNAVPKSTVNESGQQSGALVPSLRNKLTPEINKGKIHLSLKGLGILKSSQRCTADTLFEDINSTEKVTSRNNNCNYGGNESKRCANNKSSHMNSEEITNYTFNGKSIKLKKAVVVLTDFTKTKYFKDKVTAFLANNKQEKNKTTEDVSSPVVKQELLTSSSPVANNNPRNSAQCSSFDTKQSSESVNFTSSSSGILTQLAEGCNFSEILNKFKLLQRGSGVVIAKKSNSESPEINEKSTNGLGQSEHFNNNVTDGHNENEINILPLATESTEFEEHKVFSRPAGCECIEKCNSGMCTGNHCLWASVKSDCSKGISKAQSTSASVSEDQKPIHSPALDSSDHSVKILYEKRVCNSGKFGNCLNNSGSSNLNLVEFEIRKKFEKKIMKRKNRPPTDGTEKKKSKPKDKSAGTHHLASSEKMKKKPNKKKLHKKGAKPLPEDYIPLNASGPTKFGVATLNQIQPYKQHSAKDFKNKMLFGDRVPRFTSQDQLKMYRLKQRASRRTGASLN